MNEYCTTSGHDMGCAFTNQARVHRYQEHHFALCERFNNDLPRLAGQQVGQLGVCVARCE